MLRTESARRPLAAAAMNDSPTVDELLTMLESATSAGEADSVKALAMAGVRADLLDGGGRTALLASRWKVASEACLTLTSVLVVQVGVNGGCSVVADRRSIAS